MPMLRCFSGIDPHAVSLPDWSSVAAVKDVLPWLVKGTVVVFVVSSMLSIGLPARACPAIAESASRFPAIDWRAERTGEYRRLAEWA